MGFEKEINSLLKKLELRKGRGVKIARGKKKSPLATRLEREIRKLECSVNYDCAPLSVREGGGAVESVLPPFEGVVLSAIAFPFRESPVVFLFLWAYSQSEVVPAKSKEKGKEREVRDDGEGDTRAGFKRVREKTCGAPAKVDVKYKVGEGSCSKQAQSSGTVSGAATEMDGSTGDRSSARGKSPCSGLGGNLPLGRKVEEESRRGICLVSTLGSLRPTINFSEITDEALLEEASRYSDQTHSPFLSLGKRDISLFSTPSGWDGEGAVMVRVSDRGTASDDGGGAVMDPLRVILADGREEVVSNLVGRGSGNTEELSVGALERASQEDEEERGKEGDLCWQSSSLAKFSRYLGMPTEGFEGEILFLLKRMKERKLQKGKLDGRKRRKLELSKFERELRKLEWTVNYMGGGGGGEGGGSMSRKNKVDLVCLQETKIQEMSMGIVRSLGVGRFLDWGAVDSRGAAGGIVSCEDGFIWTFTGVYGPTLRRKRESFWEELGAIKGLWNGPWCVARDFNAILRPEESSRGGSLNSIMRRFAEVIEELELKDLPMVGGPFTWTGGTDNQSFSRLDRFLVNEEWDSHFGDARQFLLPRPVSDHFPILMDGGGLRRGPTPFRFENMWLKAEGCKGSFEAMVGGRQFQRIRKFYIG
ncbi:hypothetical protein CK203_063068 [Vitis vinifera]|uniref:Endonuclease/exonuclease/phosphatase domain-containing protein n=1 Tax=Vitis vinifera TaxID=29760 RepID=A0A438G638_VITVI|nr:hypothetical protein CK203_063068 [Vitis vinifera]